ncbi:MAG: hypothetical protein ACYDA6_08250, partial [Solirubrobacteraceae bacterium]
RDGGREPLFFAELTNPALTIEDPTPPTKPTLAGALLSTRYATGTLAAAYATTDHLIGVKRLVLDVDGKPATEQALACEVNSTLEAHSSYPEGAND